MDNFYKNKEPFYIFFEVNGVLYDEKFAYNFHGPFFYPIDDPKIKETSMTAFNNLIQTLEENYDTKLVLISKRRKNLDNCVRYLKNYGLIYDKPIFATEFKKGARGQKILDSMSKDGLNPTKKPTLKDFVSNLLMSSKNNPKFKNYVVINPPSSKISRYIRNNHLIKTDPIRNSLTQQQVDDFLEQFNSSNSKQM